MATPLRELVGKQDNVQVLLGEVTTVNPEGKQIVFNGKAYSYDHLVLATGSGSTYLFQPTPDNKGHVDPKCNYNKKCDTLRPFQAKSVRLLTVPTALATLTRVSQSECLKMWYCDTRVDVGVTELLFRQTNFLIRNMKRELTKSKRAMPFNGGRNPAGRVAKLD
mgnify:CR=1 FL=1